MILFHGGGARRQAFVRDVSEDQEVVLPDRKDVEAVASDAPVRYENMSE